MELNSQERARHGKGKKSEAEISLKASQEDRQVSLCVFCKGAQALEWGLDDIMPWEGSRRSLTVLSWHGWWVNVDWHDQGERWLWVRDQSEKSTMHHDWHELTWSFREGIEWTLSQITWVDMDFNGDSELCGMPCPFRLWPCSSGLETSPSKTQAGLWLDTAH